MVDQKKIEEAVRLLLEGIGEDVTREGLADTPGRIARMYEEIYRGMDDDPARHLSKTFTVSTILCLSMARYILPICLQAGSWDSASWHARWRYMPGDCRYRSR